MSHHTVQQTLVRMLFDEAFVERVLSSPEEALAGLELSDAERKDLLGVDRRAWRHDPLRKRRTLRTLAEEYKISTTLALAETRSLASLERFFSSPQFHQTIQNRGSLSAGFAEFLRRGSWKTPQITDVIRLEAAIAGCRRSLEREGGAVISNLPSTISDRSRVKLAPGCDVGGFEGNVIESIQCVERYLFELSLMPAMALCEDAPQLTGLPDVDLQKKTYLLFSPGATGISITNLDKASYLTLYEAKRPVEIKKLLTAPAKSHVQKVERILSEWLDHGALMLVE
jgi:hypothetical protein